MFLDESKKNVFVQIRTTEKNKSKLKRLADSENLTITNFIFKCIDFYLKNGCK